MKYEDISFDTNMRKQIASQESARNASAMARIWQIKSVAGEVAGENESEAESEAEAKAAASEVALQSGAQAKSVTEEQLQRSAARRSNDYWGATRTRPSRTRTRTSRVESERRRSQRLTHRYFDRPTATTTITTYDMTARARRRTEKHDYMYSSMYFTTSRTRKL